VAAQDLELYSGRLNAEQIAAGMNAARQNAARLLADAQMLLNAGRYPTAASIAILCIEEAGRISLLRRMATCKDEAERGEVWKEYRSDRCKSRRAIVPSLVAQGLHHIDGLSNAFDVRTKQSGTIDLLKHLGFYTDCLSDADWSMPELIIERQLAEQFIAIAHIASAGNDYRHTAKEIELWEAHMGPVMDKPFEWVRTAFANWQRAMVEHGLMDARLDRS